MKQEDNYEDEYLHDIEPTRYYPSTYDTEPQPEFISLWHFVLYAAILGLFLVLLALVT